MKIALLHPHGGMGDLILSYPVISAFREAYPKAEIIYVTPPGFEEVIRANPLVSCVLPLAQGIKPALLLAKDFREQQVDLGCALWTTARTAWILRLASIPVRIGQGGRLLYSFLFTHSVEVRSAFGDEESHWVECLLDFPRALGLQPGSKEIQLPVSETALQKAENILRESGVPDFDSMVVLHCGKGENVIHRGWPIEKFALVADELTKKGVHVVLTGGAKEVPLVLAVVKAMKTKAYSLAGKTDFTSLAGVIKRARVVICPDSGPMHLAAAVGTPVVALFLMQKDFPKRWGPWNVPSRIIRPQVFPCRGSCTKENCPDFRCYQEMPVEKIVSAALELANLEVVNAK